MGDPSYPIFSVFAFLGFLVALIPMTWHLQAWNAGTCIFMLWTSLASLVEFVDSMVWDGNARDVAPVWCDITTKFLIGAGVGIPASTLCINRRLFKIASIRSASITYDEKRRAMLEDIGIAIGIPVVVMVLHYVVQGHRFNILENIGCTPDTYNTPAAYPLVFIWPVLLGSVSFIYAAFTLRSFWIRRAHFSEFLSSNSSMTVSRYFRLILFCCTDISCTVPLGAFSIYINNAGVEMAPYISWANVHYNFSAVDIIPAEIWTSKQAFYISVEMGRWIYPGSAFLFFVLFGFAEEARRHYRAAFWVVMKLVCVHSPSSSTRFDFMHASKEIKSASDETLPPYSPRTPNRQKRPESLSSSLAGSVVDLDIEKVVQSPQPSFTAVGRDDSFCKDLPLLSQLSEYSEPRAAPNSPFDPRIIISEEYPHEFLLRERREPPPICGSSILQMSSPPSCAAAAHAGLTVHIETV